MNTATAMKIIVPDWRLVKLDDTHFCDENWRREVKLKACGVFYLYDRNRHVHCCELTPSYELHAVATWNEFECEDPTCFDECNPERVREAVDDVLRDAMYEQSVIYVWTFQLRAPEQIIAHPPEREADEDEEAFYDRAVEELREYYQGNSPWF